MKNEIKKLYKQDKDLAFEVAKVLGYKITAEGATSKKIKSNLKSIEKKLDDLAKILDNSGISGKVNTDSHIKKVKDIISNLRVAFLGEALNLGI